MDESTFQAFYEETAPNLRAFIRRASGNVTLADDLFQEAFYRFLRAKLPVLDRRQMRAYLYKTALSLLSDHWRRRKREQFWSLPMLFGNRTAEANPPSGDVERLFAQLKPQEQTLLWLAYVEGFDHGEIASALELGEKSVRVLLFRARKKLAGILTREGIAPEGRK